MERTFTFTKVAVGLTCCCSLLVLANVTSKVKDVDTLKETVSNNNTQTSNSTKIPESCKNTAEQLTRYMNKSVDPCEDFYEYVCGQFPIHHPLKDGEGRITAFSLVEEKLNQNLKNVLEEPSKNGTPYFVNITREVYRACMDIKRIDDLGFKPLEKDLELLGGWPVVNVIKKNHKFDWVQALIKMRDEGIEHDVIFSIDITTDFKNYTRNMIDVGQPSFGLPIDYLLRGLKDPTVRLYYTIMVAAAVHLGADEKIAKQEMLDALLFEMHLAQHALSRVEQRNTSALYNPMKMKDLENLAGKVHWRKLLQSTVGTIIRDEDDINISSLTYVRTIAETLAKTNKITIANYMLWRVVLNSLATLGSLGRKLSTDLSKAVQGQGEKNERWKTCVDMLSNSLPESVSALYVRRYVDPESQVEVKEIVNYVQTQVLNLIDDSQWMDKKTADRAKLKINALIKNVGYPKQLLNDDVMDKFHEQLCTCDGDYYAGVKALRKWREDVKFGRLRERVTRDDWRDWANAAMVNAFYSPNQNSINIPSGILEVPFFGVLRQRALNYGSIAWVAGHEITHALDDEGRNFDENGNYFDWWSEEANVNYEKRAQCLVKQYSAQTIPLTGGHVNGQLTLGENIADNGGIKVAYKAYLEWVNDNGKEPSCLDGFTTKQELFISAANIWCTNENREHALFASDTDPHSPHRFRVNVPLKNSVYFAEVFNCKPGSNMNPKKTCNLW